MTIYGIAVDLSRGFDVLKGKQLLAHFDTYAEACDYAAKAVGRWIRYWSAESK